MEIGRRLAPPPYENLPIEAPNFIGAIATLEAPAMTISYIETSAPTSRPFAGMARVVVAGASSMEAPHQ
ncbi:hypothetical protein LMG27198_33030 [Methylocystis echinoides]|uniref:Uncharacterized protein n=1 Tax=Methylocystis echinoides TaxID=29468 RepID=A0A9W6LTB1_9HYPH|nr:hypothetical protein LMG27198_33030 [Methylocystis echinoides]